MELNTIMRKLENKAQTVNARFMERGIEKRVTYRNASGLVFKVRSTYFANSSGSCGFDPVTLDGHSYRWYALTRKIKGHVVLNDYRYSIQTSKHIGQVSEVMRDLGIKYITLEAPRGLQDLDAALKHAVSRLAECEVKTKYARKKGGWTAYQKRAALKDLKTLEALGKRMTKKMLKAAIKDAEDYRQARLERDREKRAEKKAMASLKIVADFEGSKFSRPGLHLFKPHAWSWNEETGEFTGSVADYDRREALRKGFDAIIIHRTEPVIERHLKVVE